MRTSVAYLLSCALLILGGKWAWLFVRPMIEIPADGSMQPIVYSLVAMSAIACGLVCGAVFSLLTRPGQLRHASMFAGGVAVLSFALNVAPRLVPPNSPMVMMLEGLWVLPFVVSALACAAITRARALERELEGTKVD